MGKVKDRNRRLKAESLKRKRQAKEGVPHNSPSAAVLRELDMRREKNVEDQRTISRLTMALEEIVERSAKSRGGVARATHDIAVHALKITER